VTDLSDASGTNLLDIEKQTWSTELIQAFQIRAEIFPLRTTPAPTQAQEPSPPPITTGIPSINPVSFAACLLQAKDYIIYRLTGQFVTDLSDASGTNLLDIEKQWHPS